MSQVPIGEDFGPSGPAARGVHVAGISGRVWLAGPDPTTLPAVVLLRQCGVSGIRSFSLALLSSWLLGLGACTTGPAHTQRQLGKCIWVSRWEYKTQADIDSVMRRCAGAGFDTVFLQVRGNGTVHYSSRVEVWANSYQHRSPGFDPLSYAVVAAHAHGLKLHAWINMMPGWSGDSPPAVARQLFRSRPEWFLRKAGGALAKEGGGSYLWLNPCLPDVRSYLIGICDEVASGYGVDGIHLDYIRFPAGPDSAASPRDQRSLSLFTRQTGRPVGDAEAFRRWKTGCITEIVSGVRRRLQRLPRQILLTAAVNQDLTIAREQTLQDWPAWGRHGLVDAVIAMNYTNDSALFVTRCQELLAAAGSTPVIMGIGVYKHQQAKLGARATMRQMDAAIRSGAAGICLFSYSSSFKGDWTQAMAYWNRTRKLPR